MNLNPNHGEEKILSNNLSRIYLWGVAFFLTMFVLMVRLLPALISE